MLDTQIYKHLRARTLYFFFQKTIDFKVYEICDSNEYTHIYIYFFFNENNIH